jgi:putative MATE family efflux protein
MRGDGIMSSAHKVKNMSIGAAGSRLWRELRLAVSGSPQEYTSGSLGRAVFLLSVPMVLETLMESVFCVVDVYFLSRLGPEAVAAVGLTESLLTVVYALGMGVSVATTAMVARRIGENDPPAAAAAAGQAVVLCLALTLPLMIGGAGGAAGLLRLMGATAAVERVGAGYTAVIMASSGFVMMLFVLNAVFRGAGDAVAAMRVLWLANLLNMILDPCLIFGWGFFPEMGVTGAAVATCIGRGSGLLYQWYLLYRGKGKVKLLAHHLRLRLALLGRLARLSLGGIGQALIVTTSWIGLMRIMAEFGSVALAGYTIAIRIIVFSILPAWGIANAAATLVGQNLGAGKPDRARRSAWIAGWSNTLFLALVGAVFFVLPGTLMGIFTTEVEVVRSGSACLKILAVGYLFYALGMVMIQSLNGAGDTRTPMFINFFCFWLVEIPLAYGLALELGLRETGIYLSIVIAESLAGVLGLVFFVRGRWEKVRV